MLGKVVKVIAVAAVSAALIAQATLGGAEPDRAANEDRPVAAEVEPAAGTDDLGPTQFCGVERTYTRGDTTVTVEPCLSSYATGGMLFVQPLARITVIGPDLAYCRVGVVVQRADLLEPTDRAGRPVQL